MPPYGAAPGVPPAPKKKGGGKKAIAAALVVIGLLAVVLVGALAYRAVRGGGGGASSPEAAVTDFAEAISAEDAAGAAAVLDPEEVHSLGTLLDDVEAQAKSSGFSSPDDALKGVDLEVKGLELDSEEVGDGVAKVTINDGSVSYTLDPGTIEGTASGLLGDEDANEGTLDAQDIADSDRLDSDPFLMVVEQDGGWYVSLTYTAAEYARLWWDLPEADFDAEATLGDPAETPEAAVTQIVESGGAFDVEGTQSLLPEQEWGAAVAYERAITKVLEGDSEDLRVEVSDVDVKVDDTDLTTEELDDGASRVTLKGASGDVSWTDDDGSHSAQWEQDGWCMTVTQEDEDDPSQSCVLFPDDYLTKALDLGDPSVVTVEERGGWVVSPMRTVLQLGRDALPKLTPDLVVTLAGRPDLVKPAADPITLGQPIEVDPGPSGVATYTFRPEADGEVRVEVTDAPEEFPDYDLFDVATGEEPDYGVAGDQVQAGGEYRLVVQMYDSTSANPTVVLGAVDQQPLPSGALDSGVEGTLDEATVARIYTFTPQEDEVVLFSSDDPVSVSLRTDGYTVDCGEDDVCELEGGTEHFLIVDQDDEDLPIDYTVSFSQSSGAGGATIDGQSSLSGDVGSGERATHLLNVPSGTTITLTVTPGAESDLVVELDGESFDSGYSGDAEVLTITGPYANEPVVVRGFAGQETSYTIVITPG